jgi:hypothetical protein
MRRRPLALALVLAGLIAVSCSLNPQPLPPASNETANPPPMPGSDAGTPDNGGGGKSDSSTETGPAGVDAGVDAGGVPPPVTDGASPDGDAGPLDAEPPDGALDAPTDAPATD